MKPLPLLAILAALLPGLAGAPSHAGDASVGDDGKPQFRICYFSINNGDEITNVQAFMDKLSQQAPFDVLVEEHQPEGENPNQAFKKMLDDYVAQGKQCNAIIFSGHHTGNFGGARAKSGTRLKLDYLEDLSCNPKYRDFFRGVNAYWGEGCRTMGAEVAPDDPNELDANWQANRVGNAAEGDQLYQGMAALENEFTNTLDQDNPLSSRYMRLFPNAKLFGWTKRSPGDQAGSKFSLTFHIAHMARLLDEQEHFPTQGPNTQNDFTPENAARYADAVLALLAATPEDQKSCDNLATEAWHNHGDVKVSRSFTYDNPYANGFIPLAKSQDASTLLNAKDLDCSLKNAARSGDPGKLNDVLDNLVQQPDVLRYSLNSLVDLRNELRQRASREASSQNPNVQAKAATDQSKAAAVLSKLQQQPKIKELLQSKLNSSAVGVLRKVDYYEFYRQLNGTTLPDLEESIQKKAELELTKPLPGNPGDHYARWEQVDYRKTLLQSLLKNHIADDDFLANLVEKNPDREVLQLVRQNINYAPADQRAELAEELDERIASMQAWVDQETGDSIAAGGAPQVNLNGTAGVVQPRRPAVAPAVTDVAPQPAPQPGDNGFLMPDFLKNFFQ
jgi:hypothetical protein